MTVTHWLTDEQLEEAERRARRFSGAWTGTSGTLAALLVHAINMIRHYQEACKVKEQAGDTVRFASGAVRSSDAEATRFDLISPIGLEAVARTCAEGAAKYGDIKSVPILLSECMSEAYKFLSGSRESQHLPKAALAIMRAIQVCHDEKIG